VLDQSSITRFIEDNWSLGRIGTGSFDAIAGDVGTLLDFTQKRNVLLILNPSTGQVTGVTE
jgi:phospholipase C